MEGAMMEADPQVTDDMSFMDVGAGMRPQPGEVVDVTPGEFAGLRGDVAGQIRSLMESGGGPRFEGEFAADMTGQEQQLLQQVGQQAQPSQETGQAMDTLSRTLQGDFLSPDSNPFLQQSIEAAQRPVIQQFEQQAMPRLRSEFTQAGQRVQPQGSSPFDRAAAIAQQGLTQELGDISSEMAAQNFQQERGRQMDAAQLVPQIDQAQLEQAVSGMEASALPRLIEQQGIDRGLEEFRRRTDALMNAIQMGGQLGAPSTEVTQPTPGMQGTMAGFLGGFGSGLGSMFSA